jgi:hypothetical protein
MGNALKDADSQRFSGIRDKPKAGSEMALPLFISFGNHRLLNHLAIVDK